MKKKSLNRLTAALLSLCMTLSLLPVSVLAAPLYNVGMNGAEGLHVTIQNLDDEPKREPAEETGTPVVTRNTKLLVSGAGDGEYTFALAPSDGSNSFSTKTVALETGIQTVYSMFDGGALKDPSGGDLVDGRTYWFMVKAGDAIAPLGSEENLLEQKVIFREGSVSCALTITGPLGGVEANQAEINPLSRFRLTGEDVQDSAYLQCNVKNGSDTWYGITLTNGLSDLFSDGNSQMPLVDGATYIIRSYPQGDYNGAVRTLEVKYNAAIPASVFPTNFAAKKGMAEGTVDLTWTPAAAASAEGANSDFCRLSLCTYNLDSNYPTNDYENDLSDSLNVRSATVASSGRPEIYALTTTICADFNSYFAKKFTGAVYTWTDAGSGGPTSTDGIQIAGGGTDFDTGSTFTVTVSDTDGVAGGFLLWRRQGENWNYSGSSRWLNDADDTQPFTVEAPWSNIAGSAALTRGAYEVMFLAYDKAGNCSELKGTFTYGPLPAPENVKVSMAENMATVTWDEVLGAKEYNIYLGDNHADTAVGSPATLCLAPWWSNESTPPTYQVSVAAVKASGDEGEKSAPVTVQVQRDITPPTITVKDPPYTESKGDFTFQAVGRDSGIVAYYQGEVLPPTGETVLLKSDKRNTQTGSGSSKVWPAPDTDTVISHFLETTQTLDHSHYEFGENLDETTKNTYFKGNGWQLKDGKYRYRLTIWDTGGNYAQETIDFTVANDVPPLPEGFTTIQPYLAVNSSSGKAKVSWTGALNEGEKVKVYISSGYETAAARDAALAAIPHSEGLYEADFWGNDSTVGESSVTCDFESGSQESVNGKYYFYLTARVNSGGTASPWRAGTFDTLYAGKNITLDSVTYDGSLLPAGGGTDLSQGKDLSVTVSADFAEDPVWTSRYRAELSRIVNGTKTQVCSQNMTQAGDVLTATLTYTVPTGELLWSGSCLLRVELVPSFGEDTFFKDRFYREFPLNLEPLPDNDSPKLNSVTPGSSEGISGAQVFTLSATDNSGAIAGAEVEYKLPADASWSPLPEGALAEDFTAVSGGGTVKLDTTKLIADDQGNLMLRFKVRDAGKNNSGGENWSDWIQHRYALANTVPPAPATVGATAGELTVTLVWSNVPRADVTGYRIDRSVDGGTYTEIKRVTGTNTWNDTELDPTKAYRYRVMAVTADQVGTPFETGAVYPLPQKDGPTILSLEPYHGGTFRNGTTVKAQLEDNSSALPTVSFQYAWLGENSQAEPGTGTVWHDMAAPTVTSAGTNELSKRHIFHAVTTLTLAGEDVNSRGWFAIRVKATNGSSKTSTYYVRCLYDNEAPDPVTGLAAADEGTGSALTLTFTPSASPDTVEYKVYRNTSSDRTGAGSIGSTAAGAFRDSGLTLGSTYYYWVTALDRAGNESASVGPVSAVVGQRCDVQAKDLSWESGVLTVGQPSPVIVSLHNAGPAKASGTLTVTADYGSGNLTVGTVALGDGADGPALAPGETRKVTAPFTPTEGTTVTLTASFSCAIDSDTANNTVSSDSVALNHAPVVTWTLPTQAKTGGTLVFSSQSSDTDGDAMTYTWDLGGEKKTGPQVSHRFMVPGDYAIALAVTDSKGAVTGLTSTLTVADDRPNLSVTSITVSRKLGDDSYEPVYQNDTAVEGKTILENDTVRVTAVIGNEGTGAVPADMSFLTSFILNGVSQGYQTLTGLEAGGTKEVSFLYTAKAGGQVIKIVTNDILHAISELDMSNNTAVVMLNADQTTFADIKVDAATWLNGTTMTQAPAFTTQDEVIYSADVANIGQADATFTLTLYVDGVVQGQRTVSRAAGGSGRESFSLTPTAGAHTILLVAGGELLDKDESNNSAALNTAGFTVATPTLTLSPITIQYPTGTEQTPSQGSTLRFNVTLSTNLTITVPFDVTFGVDGKPLKTVTLAKDGGTGVVLSPGTPQQVSAEWVVQDGVHEVTVTADPKGAVVEIPLIQTALTKDLTVVKPDLWISDVFNAPADTFAYGGSAQFAVRVSNRSVATLFDKYALVLSEAEVTDGTAGAYREVTRYQYNGIQGHSTSVQLLTYTPKKAGKYKIKIDLAPVGGADFQQSYNIPYEFDYTVADSLKLVTSPNQSGESNDFGANMYVSSMTSIPVSASAMLSDGGGYLKAGNGLTIRADILGTNVGMALTDNGSGVFRASLPVSGLSTGTYTLRFTAAYGGHSATSETQIIFVEDVRGQVTVDKAQVTAGETVTITGTVSNSYDGIIVLDMGLLPCYGVNMPDGTFAESGSIANGQPVWRGQKILFLEPGKLPTGATYTVGTPTTFTYTFTPTVHESGQWNINAYAYERLLGSGITGTELTVYGMETSSTEFKATATKGTNFTVPVKLYNAAWDGAVGEITGVTAVLTPSSSYSGITVTPDYTDWDNNGASHTLPVDKTGKALKLNVSTTAGAPDYAEYTLTFSGTGGAMTVSTQTTLKLYLRPALANPVATPGVVTVSGNPGSEIVRTVTVKNKGLGSMTDIRVEGPGESFITVENLSKTSLASRESLTLDIRFAPQVGTRLGTYQDKVVLKNGDGTVSCTIPVGMEVNTLDTGNVTFALTDDFGEVVKNAQIKLYGREAQVQMVNGVESEYYLNYTLTTDAGGFAVLEGKPAGVYDYVITASGKETLEGVFTLMPGVSGQVETVRLTTLPVQITWSVTETTIVDRYDITLNIDMGVRIPTPSLGTSVPWFTIPKQVDSPVILTTNIVNNSLIEVYNVTAEVNATANPGVSVLGGGSVGSIPAMGYKTVQLLVQPGYYALQTRPNASMQLTVKGNYVSYDADGFPEEPKDVRVTVPVYNPASSRVNVDTVLPGNDTVQSSSIQMPEDAEITELEYLLYHKELGTVKPSTPPSGTVLEVVKLELNQTASLERQAFDATLTVTNNYSAGTSLDGLAGQVVVEQVNEDQTVTDATDKMYIIPQRTAPSTLASGETATLTWKLIPGEGMGGETGKQYRVRSNVGYTVVNGTKQTPVQTSTQAVEITVKPQPALTVSYYLPHKVYPGEPFRLAVSVENTGYGEAKNMVLDSSQLEIKSNVSGLAGTWQIVNTSFGGVTAPGNGTFRVSLGNVAPGATVSGYYTLRWDLPASAGSLADGVYGEVMDFTASLTHRPYEGVELNPLIKAVYTYVVGKEEVSIVNSVGQAETCSVLMGDHGLPAAFWNRTTNVKVPVHVPAQLTGTLNGGEYTFTAPTTAETLADSGTRHAILMIGEMSAVKGTPIREVLRYDDAAMAGAATQLAGGNYWTDSYTDVSGTEVDYLYIVDELKLDSQGRALPRYYKVVYDLGLTLSEPVTSQIAYIEVNHGTERTAVLYPTGRNHERNDNLPAKLAVKVTNMSGDTVNGNLIFSAAPYVDGRLGSFTQIKSQPVTLAANAAQTVTVEWNLLSANLTYNRYCVKMAVENGGEVTADICFNASPVGDAGVDFSGDVLTPLAFDASRSYDPDGGNILLYIWDFGDGESAYGPQPTHTYQASGTYIATLYVLDDNGTENTRTWNDAAHRPSNSSAVHDVMVTVKETRPDLIIAESGGLTVAAGPHSVGGTVNITALVKNDSDEGVPVKDDFIVTLYVDNVYQGYQWVKLGGTPMAKGDTKTVTFAWTMPDSLSHVVTVKANDVSITVAEADLLNNQRSAVIVGSSGKTTFPDLEVSGITLDALSPDDQGIVWPTAEKQLVYAAGTEIPITATVKNVGQEASEATAAILYVDGEYASMVSLQGLGVNESCTVSFTYALRQSGGHTFTVMADGPAPKLVESSRNNNEISCKVADMAVEYPNLTVTDLTVTQSGSSATFTAQVKNEGSAASAATTVAFYAGSRFIGSAPMAALPAGGSATVSYTWTDLARESVFAAVADPEGKVPEMDRLNNSRTLAGEVTIREPVRPALKVTGINTAGAVSFGNDATTAVTVKNEGEGPAGPFTVALYTNGSLAGTGSCAGLAAGSADTVNVSWTADMTPTGTYTLTAVADRDYQVVMSSRQGTVLAAEQPVGRGILAAFRSTPDVLTRNNGNTLSITVTDSDTGGYAPSAAVTFSLDGTTLGTGTYDSSTGAYVLPAADLSAVAEGSHTLKATASYTVDGQTYTDEVSKSVTVAPSVTLTLALDKTIAGTGETVHVSGTTNAADGTDVTLTLAGDTVHTWHTAVTGGSYALNIPLPASLGGAVQVSAAVKSSGITKKAYSSLMVYGLYLSLPAAGDVAQGHTLRLSGEAANVGYTDMDNVKLTLTNGDGLTVHFRNTGGVYDVPGSTGVSISTLERTENAVSINGSGVEYDALPFGLEVSAPAGAAVEEHTLTFTLAGTTGAPNAGSSWSKTFTLPVTVTAARGELRLDTGDKNNPGAVDKAVRLGQTMAASIQVTNVGSADITGLTVTGGSKLPWVTLQLTSLGGEETTLHTYRETAQRLIVTVTAAPTEKVAPGVYSDTVTISGTANGTAVSETVPLVYHVSAAHIGTAVAQLVDDENALLTNTQVTFFGPVDAPEPKEYTFTTHEVTGQVTLTNLPAGEYEVWAPSTNHGKAAQPFTIYPAIDLTPRRVTLPLKPLTLTLKTEETLGERVTASESPSFQSIVYELATQPTTQAGLVFNYPADEFGASYALNRAASLISVKNSCAETVTAYNGTLRDVVFTLESDDPALKGLLSFRGDNGSVPKITRSTLAPGEQVDLLWELSQEALYVQAQVAQAGENTYTVTLPAGSGLVWGGAEGIFPTWNSENGGCYRLTGVSGDAATVTAVADANGTMPGAPDGRVPRVRLVDADGKMLRPGFEVDFTLKATGIRKTSETDSGETVTRSIPLRVSYTAREYYLVSDADTLRSDMRLEGAFPSLSGVGYKYFSQDFLSDANVTETSDVSDSGFRLGFAQNTTYANKGQVLTVEFENPSRLEAISDLNFEVVFSDQLPDAGGALARGALYRNDAFAVTPVIEGSGASVEPDGSIRLDGTVVPGAGLTARFHLTPVAQLVDNAALEYLVENEVMTAEDASAAADWLNSTAGDYYAWIRYSYKRGDATVTGSTAPVKQSAKPLPELYTTYKLYESSKSGDANIWYLETVTTNIGSGPAEDVTLQTPALPASDGSMVRILTAAASKNGEDFPEGWETTAHYTGPMKVGTLHSGDTVYAVYRILVLSASSSASPEPPELLEDAQPELPVTVPTPDEPSTPGGAGETVLPNGLAEAGEGYGSVDIFTLYMLQGLFNGDYNGATEESISSVSSNDYWFRTWISNRDLPLLDQHLEGGYLAPGQKYGMEGLYEATESRYADMLSDYLYALNQNDDWSKLFSESNDVFSWISIGIGLVGAANFGEMADNIAEKLAGSLLTRQSYVADLRALRFFDMKGRAAWYKEQMTKTYCYIQNLLIRGKTSLLTASAGKALKTAAANADNLAASLGGKMLKVNQATAGKTIQTGMFKGQTYEAAAAAANRELAESQDLLREYAKTLREIQSVEKEVPDDILQKLARLEGEMAEKLGRADTQLQSIVTAGEKEGVIDLVEIIANDKVTGNIQLTGGRITDLGANNGSDTMTSLARMTGKNQGAVKAYSAGKKAIAATDDDYGKFLDELKDLVPNTINTGNAATLYDLGTAKIRAEEAVKDGRYEDALNELTPTLVGILSGSDYGALAGQLTAEGLGGETEFSVLAKNIRSVLGTLLNLALEDIIQEDAQTVSSGLRAMAGVMSEAIYSNDRQNELSRKFVALLDEHAQDDNLKHVIKPLAAEEREAYRTELAGELTRLMKGMPLYDTGSFIRNYNDTWYNKLMDLFMDKYVERIYIPVYDGTDPYKALKDQANWYNMDEAALLKLFIGKTVSKKTFGELRETYKQEMQTAKEATYSIQSWVDYDANGNALGNQRYANYPVAAMVEYMDILNSYIITAQRGGRSLAPLRPISFYGGSTGADGKLTFTAGEARLDFSAFVRAINQHGRGLSALYDVSDDWYNLWRYNFAMKTNMALADAVSLAGGSLVGLLGGTMSTVINMAWDVTSIQLQSDLNKRTQNAISMVNMKQGEATVELLRLLSQETYALHTTAELFKTLAKWKGVDPALPVEMVGFSVSDARVSCDDGSGTAKGMLSLHNAYTGTVVIEPRVRLLNKEGLVSDMTLNTWSVAPGETVTQDFNIELPRSIYTDPAGYIALLTYRAGEEATATVATEEGPYLAHFWVDTDTVVDRMRSGADGTDRVAASAFYDGAPANTTLVGKANVTPGTRELRILLAAREGSGVTLSVTGPGTGTVKKVSVNNENDYWILSAPAAGEYTITASIPEGYRGRAAIETMTFSRSGAMFDLLAGDSVAIGRDMKGNSTEGVMELLLSETGFSKDGAGAVTFSLTGLPEGLTAEFTKPVPNADGSDGLYAPLGTPTLTAGGLIAATLSVTAQESVPDGTYPVTLTVQVNKAAASLLPGGQPGGAGRWSVDGEGNSIYTRDLTILVARQRPSAPANVTVSSQPDGTVLVSGTAAPDQVVGVIASDTGEVGHEADNTCLVAVGMADSTGAFALTVTADVGGKQLVSFAASPAGTLSLGETAAAGKTVVTITVESTEKTYDGAPPALQVTTSPAGVPTEIIWSTPDGNAPVDAGSYQVTVRVPAGNESYTGANTLTYTISKAPGTAAPGYSEPTGLTGTAGQRLSAVTLPAGWAWADGTQTLEKGSRSYLAVYTPTNDNYQPASVQITVSVSDGTGGNTGGNTGGSTGGSTGGNTGGNIGSGETPVGPGNVVTNPDGSQTVTDENGNVTTSTTTTTKAPDGTVIEATQATTTSPNGTVTESKTETSTKPDGSANSTTTATTTKPDGTVTESKTETTIKPDGSSTGTTTATTAKPNGTVTESKTETATKPDGSSTATTTATTMKPDGTVTESKTETATKPDGSATATTTATTNRPNGDVTQSETTVVTSSDGSSSATTTATTQSANGTVKEEKTEVNTKTDGSSVGTTTAVSTTASGVVTETKSETVTAKDGSSVTDTTAVTTGTDGSVTTVTGKTVTATDGSSMTTATSSNGATGMVAADRTGAVTKAEAVIPAETADQAAGTGSLVTVPILVEAARDTQTAPSVQIEMPASKKDVKAEIPVDGLTPSTTIVLVGEDGSETVVPKSAVTEEGVALLITGNVTVKIVDNSKDFSDVADDVWYTDAVAFVSSREIFNGTGSGVFAPEMTMTRGMMAQALYNLESRPISDGSELFTDIHAGAWYADAVNWLADKGVVGGYGNGEFGANDIVTREQMAVMLYNYSGRPDTQGSLDGFADGDKVSSWAETAMRWAVENGIFKGKGNGILDPLTYATRAEVAQIFKNYCSLLLRSGVVIANPH